MYRPQTLFAHCCLFSILMLASSPFGLAQIQVDANNDGNWGDAWGLATEAYDPDQSILTNNLPDLKSLFSFNALNEQNVIRQVELSLDSAAFRECTGANQSLYFFPSPSTQLAAGVQAMEDSTGGDITCAVQGDQYRCEAAAQIPFSTSMFYHVACDDDGVSDASTTPPQLEVDEDLFQWASIGATVKLIDAQGVPRQTMSTNRVAEIMSQYFACVTERANHIIDTANSNMTFIGNETISRASVGVFDRNSVDTSDPEATLCAGGAARDWADLSDSFLLVQEFGGGSLGQLEMLLLGGNQDAIQQVTDHNDQTVPFDENLGGWLINGLPGENSTFNIQVSGGTAISPAAFRITATARAAAAVRSGDAQAFQDVTYLGNGDAGTWTDAPLPVLYFPHWLDGGGNKCRIYLSNISHLSDIGLVRFFDSNGNPAMVPVDGVLQDTVVYRCSPAGTCQVGTDGTSQNLQTGVIEVYSARANDSQISGTEVFTVLGNMVSVQDSPPLETQRLTVIVNSEEQTGLTLYNPDRLETKTVELLLVDEFGRLVETKLKDLAPRERILAFVTEEQFFGDYFSANTESFLGSIYVTTLESQNRIRLGAPKLSVSVGGLNQKRAGNYALSYLSSRMATKAGINYSGPLGQ